MRSRKTLRFYVCLKVLAVTTATLFLPLVRADDSSPIPSVYDQLIADVFPIHQNRRDLAMIDNTPDEVAAVQTKKPAETSNWQNLRIGEFESEPAFKRRQEEAHAQEARVYQEAIENWKRELVAAEALRTVRLTSRATIGRRDVTPKLVAYGEGKPLGKLFWVRFQKPMTLPVFDRALMGFDHVQLPGIVEEVANQGNGAILGEFKRLPIDLRIRIKEVPALDPALMGFDHVQLPGIVNNLSVAKKFKEDVAAGRVTFALQFEPWLQEIESPIITKPAHDEREFDKDAVAKTALEDLIVVIAAAAGADANTVNNGSAAAQAAQAQREHMKTVHYSAETREGVRFHFKFNPVQVVACDAAGKGLNGVNVEIIGHERVSVRFVRLNESPQEGARVLQSGDEIFRIAGKPIDHVDALAEIVNSQPAGSSFTVCYRSVLDGHQHEFTASGGRLLGITYSEVFP
jgi:hypothetical protein